MSMRLYFPRNYTKFRFEGDSGIWYRKYLYKYLSLMSLIYHDKPHKLWQNGEEVSLALVLDESAPSYQSWKTKRIFVKFIAQTCWSSAGSVEPFYKKNEVSKNICSAGTKSVEAGIKVDTFDRSSRGHLSHHQLRSWNFF